MKFAVRSWCTGSIKFEAEIDCPEDAPSSIKLGLAVKWALRNDADLTDADLTRADLTRANLTDAVLTDAVLTDADLTDADLTRAVLTRAVLTRANLTDAVLTDADLTDADLTRADLTDADLTDAVLTDADLTRAVLTRAVLTDADLTRAVLTRADLTRADLTDAVLTRAVLTDADLTRAVLTDAVLRPFKADLWLTLSSLPAAVREGEIRFLVERLRAGKIDGRTYGESAECGCLIGTLAKAPGASLDDFPDRSASHPAEQWFLQIGVGHTPENHGPTKAVLQWIEEYCLAHGISIDGGAVRS